MVGDFFLSLSLFLSSAALLPPFLSERRTGELTAGSSDKQGQCLELRRCGVVSDRHHKGTQWQALALLGFGSTRGIFILVLREGSKVAFAVSKQVTS